MTGGIILGLASALWLGILTSISPCPLTTNIAAASYIGRKVGDTKTILLSGLLYTLGRSLTYALIGIVLVSGISSTHAVSIFLQKYMHKILGPLLILTGMFLLGLLSFDLNRLEIGDKLQEKVGKSGLWGAVFLGIFLALSFCPVSAALFFGSLIPLSLKYGSKVMMPLLFGIGTGIPTIIFAFLLAFSAQSVGKFFNKLNRFEVWARYITGGIFIAVGVFFCLRYIFGII